MEQLIRTEIYQVYIIFMELNNILKSLLCLHSGLFIVYGADEKDEIMYNKIKDM